MKVLSKKLVRKPVQKRSLDKLNTILVVSKELFAKKNYFNVTTNEIAKEVSVNARRKGSWSTSKNETVVLYTIDKESIKSSATRMFNERLGAVIQKLNDYKNNFEQGVPVQTQTIETTEE